MNYYLPASNLLNFLTILFYRAKSCSNHNESLWYFKLCCANHFRNSQGDFYELVLMFFPLMYSILQVQGLWLIIVLGTKTPLFRWFLRYYFVPCFIRSFSSSFFYSFIHGFDSSIRLFIQSFVHSLIHFVRSIIHSFVHSFVRSLIHSLHFRTVYTQRASNATWRSAIWSFFHNSHGQNMKNFSYICWSWYKHKTKSPSLMNSSSIMLYVSPMFITECLLFEYRKTVLINCSGVNLPKLLTPVKTNQKCNPENV